ncbi:MAG: hypothetical protein GY815_14510 [Gammaproteobacteria bacterium]|nr:hypothetical protein [Gammaproteobacteria bacterium]
MFWASQRIERRTSNRGPLRGCFLAGSRFNIAARVTVTPGSAFDPSGEHHVRLAYCVDEDTINLAFDRIENYFPGD